jgi:hypothetical protein
MVGWRWRDLCGTKYCEYWRLEYDLLGFMSDDFWGHASSFLASLFSLAVG